MNTKLTEILKGSIKGLVGTACCVPFGLGLPVADELCKSIESKEGKIAYGVTGGLLITSIFATLYSLGN
jgi:hypothetical protein